MEIAQMLGVLPIKLISLADAGFNDEVEEYGETHKQNAILKARYFYEKTGGIPVLGEDSGVHVDAFPGELGVKTRRWGEFENATDEEWIENFLRAMADKTPEKRGAKFVCCAAIILDKKSCETPHIFEGETRGMITKKLEAPLSAGIPVSSCFRPEGCDKVYAALSVEEKNRVSHRGKAMAAVRDFLRASLLV